MHAAAGSAAGLPRRSARGQTGCSFPRVREFSAGEQGHLVAQTDELVDQPGDHPLCPAVKLGRNALGQRRDLGNPHDSWSGPLLVDDHVRTKKTYRVFLTRLPILPGLRN